MAQKMKHILIFPRRDFFIFTLKIKQTQAMSHLINHSAAHKLAKSLNIRLGSSAIEALDKRIAEIIAEGAKRAAVDKRKTILDRDIIHEPDLFS